MGHVPEKAGSNLISSMTVKRESIIRKKKLEEIQNQTVIG